MWYNPVVYTSPPLTDHEIIWAIYQHLVATTSLLFGVMILIFIAKFVMWFLPKWYARGNV